MSDLTAVELLREELSRTRASLEDLAGFYRDFLDGDFRLLGRKRSSAVILAELMTRFYTCLETLFLRISRWFENELDAERWHADLLHKMTLSISGVRPFVIRHATWMALEELRRFRHFQRYYFQLDYDWDKLEYLQKKYVDGARLIDEDLRAFEAFLSTLCETDAE